MKVQDFFCQMKHNLLVYLLSKLRFAFSNSALFWDIHQSNKLNRNNVKGFSKAINRSKNNDMFTNESFQYSRSIHGIVNRALSDVHSMSTERNEALVP